MITINHPSQARYFEVDTRRIDGAYKEMPEDKKEMLQWLLKEWDLSMAGDKGRLDIKEILNGGTNGPYLYLYPSKNAEGPLCIHSKSSHSHKNNINMWSASPQRCLLQGTHPQYGIIQYDLRYHPERRI